MFVHFIEIEHILHIPRLLPEEFERSWYNEPMMQWSLHYERNIESFDIESAKDIWSDHFKKLSDYFNLCSVYASRDDTSIEIYLSYTDREYLVELRHEVEVFSVFFSESVNGEIIMYVIIEYSLYVEE